jgi:hypothetical protein
VLPLIALDRVDDPAPVDELPALPVVPVLDEPVEEPPVVPEPVDPEPVGEDPPLMLELELESILPVT